MHKIITALKRTMEWVLRTWGEGSWAVPTPKSQLATMPRGLLVLFAAPRATERTGAERAVVAV